MFSIKPSFSFHVIMQLFVHLWILNFYESHCLQIFSFYFYIVHFIVWSSNCCLDIWCTLTILARDTLSLLEYFPVRRIELICLCLSESLVLVIKKECSFSFPRTGLFNSMGFLFPTNNAAVKKYYRNYSTMEWMWHMVLECWIYQ